MRGFAPLAYDREPRPTTVIAFTRITFTGAASSAVNGGQAGCCSCDTNSGRCWLLAGSPE